MLDSHGVRETGTVVQAQNNRYLVQFPRKTACNKCGFCQLGPQNASVWVSSEQELEIGNQVQVEMSTTSLLKGSFFVYLVPLFLFFIGFFLGSLLQKQVVIFQMFGEFFPLVCGGIFLIFTYYMLYLHDKRKKTFIKIIKIIKDVEKNDTADY